MKNSYLVAWIRCAFDYGCHPGATADEPPAGLDQAGTTDLDCLDIVIGNLNEGVRAKTWEDTDAIVQKSHIVTAVDS